MRITTNRIIYKRRIYIALVLVGISFSRDKRGIRDFGNRSEWGGFSGWAQLFNCKPRVVMLRTWAPSRYKDSLSGYRIPVIKIRRSLVGMIKIVTKMTRFSVHHIHTHTKIHTQHPKDDEHCLRYRQTSSIIRTKSPNLNVSRLVLWLSSPNQLNPGAKSTMKMQLEQRRQAMLLLHLSDQQFYCLQRCDLY